MAEPTLIQKADTGRLSSISWLIIISLAFLLVAGIIYVLLGFVCWLKAPLQAGDLSTARTIFVVFDLTESMHKQPEGTKHAVKSKQPPQPGPSNYNEVKEVVKSKILPQLYPGDFIECYQIGSNNLSFDEDTNYVFGGTRSSPPLPLVRAGISDGNISQGDLDNDCAKGPKLKEELRAQWATLDTLRNSWITSIDSARPPTDRCCSAYLAAMDYIGKRLNSDQVEGEKWLIIVGDLLEESKTITPGSYTNPNVQPSFASQADEQERNRFRNVKVLLIRPSGSQDMKLRSTLDDLWREYFQSRGASKIQFLSFNDVSGLGKTNVPRI